MRSAARLARRTSPLDRWTITPSSSAAKAASSMASRDGSEPTSSADVRGETISRSMVGFSTSGRTRNMVRSDYAGTSGAVRARANQPQAEQSRDVQQQLRGDRWVLADHRAQSALGQAQHSGAVDGGVDVERPRSLQQERHLAERIPCAEDID